MEFADVEQRWQQHVNEFFAEWGMPKEFFYESQEDGQEPQLVIDTEHPRVYAAWLATKGYITEGDSVLGFEDACLTSNISPTVVIDKCDSKVANDPLYGECTISEKISECVETATNHGKFAS